MTTSVDWPSTLPSPIQGTLENYPQEPWVDDPADVGSARRRVRFTRALERFSFSLRITEAQRVILDEFYEDDLSNGAKSFNWTHPYSGVEYQCLLAGRPRTKHLEADAYDASVSLEEI